MTKQNGVQVGLSDISQSPSTGILRKPGIGGTSLLDRFLQGGVGVTKAFTPIVPGYRYRIQ